MVQAIFESTTRTVAQGARLSAVSASPTTDDVIFCGNAMSTNEHPGNQLFKLLIQKCIKDLPQDTHSVEDIAQAFWDCHKPRKFFEWDNDAARYSRLCSSDTLYIIKYALNEEARLAHLKSVSEQENLNILAMTLEEVDGTECKRNIINDAVAFSLQNGHPPISRHHLSDKSNQPTDASHVEFYTYPPEDLDFLLTEHMESQFDLVQTLFDHNEQDQGSAFHGGLSSDSHHQMSDNANQPIEATHTEFYPYPPEDLDFLLIEQMQSQDDHVQSLFDHNEQDEENTNQTGLSCGSRDHMSDDALEPTDGGCIAPYPIGLPTNQQLRFSLEDLDHLKTVLIEQTKSQDDRIHILSDREEQGLEATSHVCLPPDCKMDSHTIDESPQGSLWFKSSEINSKDCPKDARSEQPKCQHIAVGSSLIPFMQALGLLLVQAFLQTAEITGWDHVQTMCVQSKVLQMSQGPPSVLGSFYDNRFEVDECGTQDRLSFNHVNSRAHWFLTSLMQTFIRVGCPTQ